MRHIVTIVNVGLSRVIRKPHGKRKIECKNTQFFLVGVRWFSKACRKKIDERIAKDWPTWSIMGYARVREMHPKRIN